VSGGRKFLTEREICGRYSVSRPTANKALSNLVSEGLLEFRKGVGTFVQGRALAYNLRALVSFTDKAIAACKQPSTEVLQFAGGRERRPR
jgi:DNA-binding GntR family transcriptional regulator